MIAHLLHEFPPGRSAVLLFTSPEPDDAATAAIAALSAALAPRVTGQVLAVEGSLRHVGLARQLAAKRRAGDESAPGLADVLAGKVSWRRAVRGTRVERLDVLPGRVACDDGGSAEPIARWADALREFRQEYQFVLIDASPAADAAVCGIAGWADAAYLMIRTGRTGRNAARRAVRILRECGGRVLGCVVVAPVRGGRHAR